MFNNQFLPIISLTYYSISQCQSKYAVISTIRPVITQEKCRQIISINYILLIKYYWTKRSSIDERPLIMQLYTLQIYLLLT